MSTPKGKVRPGKAARRHAVTLEIIDVPGMVPTTVNFHIVEAANDLFRVTFGDGRRFDCHPATLQRFRPFRRAASGINIDLKPISARQWLGVLSVVLEVLREERQ